MLFRSATAGDCLVDRLHIPEARPEQGETRNDEEQKAHGHFPCNGTSDLVGVPSGERHRKRYAYLALLLKANQFNAGRQYSQKDFRMVMSRIAPRFRLSGYGRLRQGTWPHRTLQQFDLETDP